MCTYFAVIPPAQGIKCFRQKVEDGKVVNNEGEVDCDDGDKCGTLTFTVDSSITIISRNCTKSDCKEKKICNRIKSHVGILGGTLTECSVSCCYTDMCNAPGKVQEEDEKEKNMR